ncbi:MAG: hypothetical protein CMJ72_15320 [Planctomycetaceae bacterium]|nr:hypothetical protein [Planctomycetaceae bacterium]
MKNFLVPAFAVVLTLALSTTSEAQTDSLAADHAANIAAGIGAMQNPLPSTHGGQWTFYAVGDAQNSPTVVATSGDVGAGVGVGWDDPGQGVGGFGQGGAHGLGPGGGDGIVQHTVGGGAISKIDYAVPQTAAYKIELNIQQRLWEAARANRIEVYLNDYDFNGSAIATLDAPVGGVFPPPGNSGTFYANLTSTDVLTIGISGNGAGGDGVGTFGSFNMLITPVPEPTTCLLLGSGLCGLIMVRRRS